MRLSYIGHASVLIEIAGLRLLTDPALRSRIGHLRRHALPPWPELFEELDAVLISHLHGDHLDRASLSKIDPEAVVIASSGAGDLLRRYGRPSVKELAHGELTEIVKSTPRGDGAGMSDRDPLRIEAVPARHGGRRQPFGPRAEVNGFEIRNHRHRIYFAGDTDLFPGMTDLATHAGRRLDVALLPIWGWGTKLGPGHLDPESAAEAVERLNPRLVVPIHWGTYFPLGLGRQAERYLTEPPERFRKALVARGLDNELCVLKPGQSIELH